METTFSVQDFLLRLASDINASLKRPIRDSKSQKLYYCNAKKQTVKHLLIAPHSTNVQPRNPEFYEFLSAAAQYYRAAWCNDRPIYIKIYISLITKDWESKGSVCDARVSYGRRFGSESFGHPTSPPNSHWH
jgi:hypothetical protein